MPNEIIKSAARTGPRGTVEENTKPVPVNARPAERRRPSSSAAIRKPSRSRSKSFANAVAEMFERWVARCEKEPAHPEGLPPGCHDLRRVHETPLARGSAAAPHRTRVLTSRITVSPMLGLSGGWRRRRSCGGSRRSGSLLPLHAGRSRPTTGCPSWSPTRPTRSSCPGCPADPVDETQALSLSKARQLLSLPAGDALPL